MKFIANSAHSLSIYFCKFLILSILTPCTFATTQFINPKWPARTIITPNNIEISVSWAVSNQEKQTGLSRLAKEKMPLNAGLLFVYPSPTQLKFWMPETLFDLDIVFLDSDFRVIAVETLKHHTASSGPNIPTTKTYTGQYVLELHASMAKKLKISKGSILKWKKPLSESFLKSLGIEQGTRP